MGGGHGTGGGIGGGGVRPRTLVLGGGGAGAEVPWDAPVAGADDAGLARGDGCFETLLAHGGPPARAVRLAAHLERLERSARSLELPAGAPTRADWERAAGTLLAGLPAGAQAVLRLTLTRGSGGPPLALATLRPVPAALLAARRDGVRAVVLARGTATTPHAPWLLGTVKALSYAVHTAALREAARRGADDALFADADGCLLEAPTATLAWLVDGRLHTPPTEGTGVLPGTTWEAVAAGAGLPSARTRLPAAALPGVDAAWLLSSVRGAVEVRSVDGRPLRRAGALTARLRALALDLPPS
ncbi:aminotransferase class IV [Kineococcus vitellinus]|uniref:aminotransferase class IV n=1 Tax=Kineococcus vitellinus TaxID=2696565 RepID=UPI00196B483F